MSWFLGLIGNYNKIHVKSLKQISQSALYNYQSHNIYFLAGGLNSTCHFNSARNSFSTVCGIGFSKINNRFKVLDTNDWKAIAGKTDNFSKLDGHFAGIYWNDKRLICFVDPLGIRNIYIYATEKFSIFSTKLHWIAQFKKDNSLNLKAFSSNWLLVNQISAESLLSDIKRLSQGGVAIFQNEKWDIKNSFWTPSGEKTDSFNNLVEGFCKIYQNDFNVSLGLSGGLDSRLLLALLLKNPPPKWSVHTFGEPENADVRVAKKIARELSLDLTYLKNTEANKLNLNDIKNYVAETYLSAPIPNILKLQFYNELHMQNKVVIDGANGEIARRRYLNRLLFFNRKALIQNDVYGILKYLKIFKADIFTKDFTKKLHEYLIKEITEFLDSMPPLNDNNIEYWLDLMAVRTRFPNLAGIEQSRSDSLIKNYMPFSQPSVLNAVFNIPLNKRRNNRLFKELINQYYPDLKKYELVKNDITYPYNSSTFKASLITLAKKKFYKNVTSKNDLICTNSFKEFLFDTIESGSFKSFGYYDHKKIISLINNFFEGNKNLKYQVDWLITFEIFRQEMFIKS